MPGPDRDIPTLGGERLVVAPHGDDALIVSLFDERGLRIAAARLDRPQGAGLAGALIDVVLPGVEEPA